MAELRGGRLFTGIAGWGDQSLHERRARDSLLLFRDKLFYNDKERRLWTWMAVLAGNPADAVALGHRRRQGSAVLYSLQMFVFSRLPFVARDANNFNTIIYGTVAYYVLVQFVWLNFAVHARYWLPYKNILFQ